MRAIDPPTDKDLMTVAVPALVRALQAASDRDTITGCMVALAKIGRDLPGQRLHELFVQRLVSKDQEVRETAALCLGIARQCAAADIDALLALASDSEVGRQLCQRAAVDDRTRAFSVYALGLCLSRLTGLQRERVVDTLVAQLGDATSHRDIRVAAIGALSQMPSPDTPVARAAHDRALAAIADYHARDVGPGEQLVQSHCPPAIARLVDRADPAADGYRALFAADLRQSIVGRGGRARSNHHIAQSSAMALGDLCRPWDQDTDPDAQYAQLLLQTWREHKDQQTRFFAILSIGRIGGVKARAALLTELESGNRSIEKPWVALAIGNLTARRIEAEKAAGRVPADDQEVGRALMAVLDEVKNPSTIGAAAIALGLCQHRAAIEPLRKQLREYGAREDVAGEIAIGLALLDEVRAANDLRDMLPRCVRRPQLLIQLTTALGRLGDGEVVDDLTAMLGDVDGGLARLSAVAGAVGQIGDRRSIGTLVQILGDEHRTPLTRAFAAVAIGGVCDKDPLPWNTRFADALNYRAAVETLTDGAAGVLDIL